MYIFSSSFSSIASIFGFTILKTKHITYIYCILFSNIQHYCLKNRVPHKIENTLEDCQHRSDLAVACDITLLEFMMTIGRTKRNALRPTTSIFII